MELGYRSVAYLIYSHIQKSLYEKQTQFGPNPALLLSLFWSFHVDHIKLPCP